MKPKYVQEPLFFADVVEKAVSFPPYAVYKKRRVHVVYYEGDGVFRVVHSDDTQSSVHRDNLTFLPTKESKQR